MKKRLLITSLFFITQMMLFQTNAFAESPWARKVTLGYNQATGNTRNSQLNLNASIKKATEDNEFSSVLDINYSSKDKKMDSQKWFSVTRYAVNFGEEKLWFYSYQLDVDHDRFANIDYRVLPSVGLGYWLIREEGWEWSVEGSLGYEITEYREKIDDQDDESPTFIARTHFRKDIFEKASITEDISIIPSLDGGGTRIKSETAFNNPLMENLDLNIKYVIDHDTEPSANTKKTDTRFMVGLSYSF